ncbi:MAG: hypothetical protein ABL989_16555 [Gammaproteobacteria bacterium]
MGLLRTVLLPWLCLTLAGAWLLLALTAGPAELQSATAALARYGAGLGPAAGGAALVCGVLVAWRAEPWLTRLATGSVLVYLSVLVILGLTVAPWIAVALALMAAWYTRPAAALSSAILALHGVGTLTAFQLALTLPRYLAGL